jgi:hypothetical protein
MRNFAKENFHSARTEVRGFKPKSETNKMQKSSKKPFCFPSKHAVPTVELFKSTYVVY